MGRDAFVNTPTKKIHCLVKDCRKEILKGQYAILIQMAKGQYYYMCGQCALDLAQEVDFMNSPEMEQRFSEIKYHERLRKQSDQTT